MFILGYREVLSDPKPWTKAISGLLCAGVMIGANLKQAVTGSRVTAKEGIGQGRLSSSCGPNNHNPWVGEFWHKRSLTQC